MMDQVYIPLLTALAVLAGAFIGSFTLLVTNWIQASYSAKRDCAKLAIEAGLADYKHASELARERKSQLAPVSTHIFFHASVLDAIARRRLTPRKLRAIYDKQSELVDVMEQFTRERKSR